MTRPADYNTPTGKWIHDLYDAQDALVARADEGRPVVVPDPGTAYGRCLVLFLGATIKETT